MSASAMVLPEKAMHQQTQTFNQQLMLRALHDPSPLPRADLARLTGSTRNSVGDLVGTLIYDGLIDEVLLDPIGLCIACEHAASRLVRAAVGDATVELPSPTEAPHARGAAANAGHRIGLPEREGVGER